MERRVCSLSQGVYKGGTDNVLSRLTNSCANNGQTTWTYNQGVIASGLAALAKATGDSSLISEAEITLDATIRLKTVNNILKETCDSATPTSTCNNDQAMFKGIWMKHLQFYLDNAPDRASKYSSFIGSQESAVIHYGTGSEWTVGNVWYAPSQGGSLFTAQTQVRVTNHQPKMCRQLTLVCRPRASLHTLVRRSMGLARYDPGPNATLMETKDEVMSCCTNILSVFEADESQLSVGRGYHAPGYSSQEQLSTLNRIVLHQLPADDILAREVIHPSYTNCERTCALDI